MISLGENQIFVQDSGGDKPALLFVHGILMDHSVFAGQVSAFADTHRVVCVDLRGFGKSVAASPDISFEDHADDLRGVIAALGLRDVTLVGWSMGGAIAMVMAASKDHTISHFVLVDSTPQLLADARFAPALPPEAAQQLGGVLVADFAAGCAAFAGLVAPENTDIAKSLTAIAADTDPAVALTAFQSAGGRSLLDILPAITTPTSIIAGADDQICPLGASEHLAANIPGCTTPTAVIEGAGHAPFLTSPAAFNAALAQAIS